MIKRILTIALTIDVEPNTNNILERTGDKYTGLTKAMPRFLDVVNKYEIPVTWFITHDYWGKIDQEFPLLVEEMKKNGEIGCHVHFRKCQGIYFKNFEFQMEIVGDATRELRAQGFNVSSFRGGNNFFDETTLRVLRTLNYKIDSSVIPGLFVKIAPGFEANHQQRLVAKPYFPSFQNHCVPGDSGILEIPLSICPYFRFQQKLMSVLISRPISIFKPTRILIRNIKRLENDSIRTPEYRSVRARIPVVLSAHPWEFLNNVERQIQDFEYFIVKAKEELNAEFVTLDQIRKKYVDRTYSSDFSESKFTLTLDNLRGFANKVSPIQKLVAYFSQKV